ncbi:MAG: hypothetical protein BWY79_00339 [Actinobacteria bacterium ADurb.Bin444]|nr:MAG: hypothetical protein BWY79_00339 [Actinobacteria bacterium ADurb.Bin444]
MNLRTLEKHYDKLTDHERFTLAMAAELRGDKAEVKRLLDTARKATYRQVAYPFAGMRDGLMIVCLVSATELLRWGTLLGLSFGLEMAAREIDGHDGERLETATLESAEKVLIQWRALELFAQDIGLEFEAVTHFLGAQEAIDLARGIAELMLGAQDPEARGKREAEAQEQADLLRQVWELEQA